MAGQRDVMRRIWARCKPDEERAVREYAAAESRGEADRASDRHDWTAEQYARGCFVTGSGRAGCRWSSAW